MKGSRCLRIQQFNEDDRLMRLDYAKEECSENIRCVGLEYDRSGHYNLENDNQNLWYKRFKVCLDSIFTSTALDKYGDMTHNVLKKVETYGNYT